MRTYFCIVVFNRENRFNCKFTVRRVGIEKGVLGNIPVIIDLDVFPFRERSQLVVTQNIVKNKGNEFVNITYEDVNNYTKDNVITELKEWEPKETYTDVLCLEMTNKTKRESLIEIIVFLFGKSILETPRRFIEGRLTEKSVPYLCRCMLLYLSVLSDYPKSQILPTSFNSNTYEQNRSYLLTLIELAYTTSL